MSTLSFAQRGWFLRTMPLSSRRFTHAGVHMRLLILIGLIVLAAGCKSASHMGGVTITHWGYTRSTRPANTVMQHLRAMAAEREMTVASEWSNSINDLSLAALTVADKDGDTYAFTFLIEPDEPTRVFISHVGNSILSQPTATSHEEKLAAMSRAFQEYINAAETKR